jgi:hypothetical protein
MNPDALFDVESLLNSRRNIRYWDYCQSGGPCSKALEQAIDQSGSDWQHFSGLYPNI